MFLSMFTGVSEQDGGEGGVVSLVDDPEPDVVTPVGNGKKLWSLPPYSDICGQS